LRKTKVSFSFTLEMTSGFSLTAIMVGLRGCGLPTGGRRTVGLLLERLSSAAFWRPFHCVLGCQPQPAP
jgi:hypothetical protein